LAEENISFNIYPNPVNDKLYIETQTQTQTIEIYDVYGRQQDYKTTRLQGNVVIDVENLKSGIYFVEIKTNEGNIVKRIVKQ
jgi:tRNA(Ile2) C34 agmatinyltransferase TiaS